MHDPEEYYEVDQDDSVAERFAGEGDDPYAEYEYNDEQGD